jgi:hypothetical protein
MDILDALNLPDLKLHILYNEACRQRTLDLLNHAKAWNPKSHQGEIEAYLKIHGDYTFGFYEDERKKLFGALNGRHRKNSSNKPTA